MLSSIAHPAVVIALRHREGLPIQLQIAGKRWREIDRAKFHQLSGLKYKYLSLSSGENTLTHLMVGDELYAPSWGEF